MIDYIKGDVAELTPTVAVVETSGVGYELNISLNTFTALSGKQSTKLYVHEAVREDAYQLYGFFDKQERVLFRQLISVSGIGPSTGRMILSSMTPSELANVIATGDVNTLKTVKGIGIKTAQRVIVDLKDKIKPDADTTLSVSSVSSAGSEEAIAALVMLGFTAKNSEKAVAKAAKDNPGATVEQLIKIALKLL